MDERLNFPGDGEAALPFEAGAIVPYGGYADTLPDGPAPAEKPVDGSPKMREVIVRARPRRIKNITDARKLLGRIAFRLQRGEIDGKEAKVLCYLLTSYIRTKELGEFEQRIESMEKLLADQITWRHGREKKHLGKKAGVPGNGDSNRGGQEDQLRP
jgi:hypothetical protein